MVKAPMRVATPLLLVVAFFAGWIIDVFYNTHGLHAFATVMLALVRPTFFRILTPANGYDERSEISLSEMKWLWFFSYVGLMLITHHMILFLFEASDWALFGLSMLRALSSAMLGLIVFGLLEFFNRGQ
jgi:disulfide bond formation protein DsbB